MVRVFWMYFTKDDINNLNNEFANEAKLKISKSIISNYFPLVQKEHIFYGVHGGAQWPGIALTDDYMAIILKQHRLDWTTYKFKRL